MRATTSSERITSRASTRSAAGKRPRTTASSLAGAAGPWEGAAAATVAATASAAPATTA